MPPKRANSPPKTPPRSRPRSRRAPEPRPMRPALYVNRQTVAGERTAAEQGVVAGRRRRARSAFDAVTAAIARTQQQIQAFDALPFAQQRGRSSYRGKLAHDLQQLQRQLIPANRRKQYWDDIYEAAGGDMFIPPPPPPPPPGGPPPPPPGGGAPGIMV